MERGSPIEPERIERRFPQESPLAQSNREALRRLARLMDSVIEIPGLRIRLGLDAILGLIPGFGDLASSAVSFYILQAAANSGVSRATLARMGFNLLVDWLLGLLPVVGDVFDIYWKSNQQNVRLLERHLDANPHARQQARRGDRWFLALLLAGLMLAVVGSLTVGYLVASAVGSLFTSPRA